MVIWKEGVSKRKRYKKTYKEKKVSITERFEKAMELAMDVNIITDTQDRYIEFTEQLEIRMKD